MDGTAGKVHPKNLGKEMQPPKASLSGWLTSKYMLCLYLDTLGSKSAPGGASLKEEAHALQCITADPCNDIPTDLLRAGSVCGLGIDLF